MTSSTKPEVLNILHCCQKRTKPWPENTYRKYREVWTCGFWDVQVDRPKDRLTDIETRRLQYFALLLGQSKYYTAIEFHSITPHHNRLRPFFRDHPGEPVPEENFWTLWCKETLTEADTPTIQLGATPSGLTSAHLHHSPNFLRAGCPSCRPTNSVKALKATSAFGFQRKH